MSAITRLAERNLSSRAEVRNAIQNISEVERLTCSLEANRRNELVTTLADANDSGSRLGDLWARALIDIADINCSQMHIKNGHVIFVLDDNGEKAQATLKQHGIAATIDIDDHDKTNTLTVDLIQLDITEKLEAALTAKRSKSREPTDEIRQEVMRDLWCDMPKIQAERTQASEIARG